MPVNGWHLGRSVYAVMAQMHARFTQKHMPQVWQCLLWCMSKRLKNVSGEVGGNAETLMFWQLSHYAPDQIGITISVRWQFGDQSWPITKS
jgi:hypothetical protein